MDVGLNAAVAKVRKQVKVGLGLGSGLGLLVKHTSKASQSSGHTSSINLGQINRCAHVIWSQTHTTSCALPHTHTHTHTPDHTGEGQGNIASEGAGARGSEGAY